MPSAQHPATGPLATGAVLAGVYEVVELQGRYRTQGVHTYTYLAHQKDVERRVLIRVLGRAYDPHGGSEAQARFLREARSTAHVDHPDLVRLYDLGLTDDSFPYMISEWMPGRTLETILTQSGPMAPARALKLFSRCLGLIGEVHAAGLVHRDLTPAGLFLSHPLQPWERLRLPHFALLFIDDPNANRLTLTGDIVGVPRYLPPEYLQHGLVTPKLDVYQMGLCLIEALTGKPAVSGRSDMDFARAHMEGQLDIPPWIRKGDLGAVMARALAIDPKERFDNAHAFADALSKVEPVSVEGAEVLPPVPVATDLVDGQYELGESIGEGGFATVCEGRDIGTGRTVAIKLMKPRPEPRKHADFTARFLQEAQIASQVRHPNMTAVHAVGLWQDRPFLVMERLKGVDLEAELADHGPMAPVALLPMFTSALDGLAEAHRMKIVHKDLKPANLFLHRESPQRVVLKILDFGVARMGFEEEARLTRTGQPVCSPSYAAPEYVTDLIASPAVDVYQMGLILVEALTGRPVVDSNNALACIMIHVKGDLDLPKALMQGPLGPILRRATSVNPDERFPDCGAFAAALRQVDPRSVVTDGESERTIQLDAPDMDCARAFVTAMIVSQRSPHDANKLLPLYATCVQYGTWPTSSKRWPQLKEMIQATAEATRARGEFTAAQRADRLALELTHKLGTM